MCGIVGVCGDNACERVFNGLKSLEYRGYDSWGIASLSDGLILLNKTVGKISDASKPANDCSIAVGHTRWATHGKVTNKNAHPHLSNDKSIAVVHNGIVENYSELRKMLEKKGFSFESETDTEIIPNLIQLKISEGADFIEAVRKSLLEIEGSYAIVVLKKDSFEMVGARNGSPLVIGVGKESNFFASDVPAFLEYTNQVIYLEDYEMAVLTNNTIKIILVNDGSEIKRVAEKINWSPEQAQKGNFEHFTLKEITEQKETIEKAAKQPTETFDKVTEMIRNAKGVFFVGCGTSYHACISSSYIFSRVTKMHVNVVLASEFRNYTEFLNSDSLVIAVSQSGETADLIDAIKAAKEKEAKIVSIVNVMGSSIMRLSNESLLMNAGPEICVLSTKSYTSQLVILLLLAYSVAGKYSEGKLLIEKTVQKIPSLIDSNIVSLRELAVKLRDSKDIFLIGRDLAYPTAMEAALKIKEVSYIHAEAFAGGELKHGTIALIEENTPVISFATERTRKLIVSNAQETKSRGAFIIGVDSEENEIYDFFIKVPALENANPIAMIIPIQILSYYLALEKKLDPDKPRNLAKSVTVK